MEDWTLDEAQSWLSEQAVYARKVLNADHDDRQEHFAESL